MKACKTCYLRRLDGRETQCHAVLFFHHTGEEMHESERRRPGYKKISRANNLLPGEWTHGQSCLESGISELEYQVMVAGGGMCGPKFDSWDLNLNLRPRR